MKNRPVCVPRAVRTWPTGRTRFSSWNAEVRPPESTISAIDPKHDQAGVIRHRPALPERLEFGEDALDKDLRAVGGMAFDDRDQALVAELLVLGIHRLGQPVG